MKDAQKPDHVGLNTLIGRLKEDQYVIPDFQRDFEWEPWDISALLRSIFLDYYIGSLLLWKGTSQNFSALSCEPIYGRSTQIDKAQYIVLDGQQRLTALNYAFLAPDQPLPKRANRAYYAIRVDKFIDEVYDEAFIYNWHSKTIDTLQKNPEQQYADHYFPLSIVGKGGWHLYGWIQDYGNYWDNKAQQAEADEDKLASQEARRYASNAKLFGEHVRSITEQYQITYIELSQDLPIDKVCDIFTQINSRGVKLDVFDLMNALLKPKGLQLKHLWRQASKRLSFVDSDKMNVYLLQVMSILRQAYCSPKYLYYLLPGEHKVVRDSDGSTRKEILVATMKEFQEGWDDAVQAMEYAIDLLKHPQEFGVTSTKYLPYVSILPVFSALQSRLKQLPVTHRLDAQRKFRHWYWASVFTNRYSGSVESTSARDFQDVCRWMENDESQPGLITEFKLRFRNLDLLKETKRGSSIYNGIFNLFVIQGARDWVTGIIPQANNLDDHHIVPVSKAKDDLEGIPVNTILNRVPLTSETNRYVIGDKLPNEYLPDWVNRSGEHAVRSIMESHFISPKALEILLRNPFGETDFDEFIAERQRTLQQAIESLLIKERLDLSPALRDLDEQIEAVELALRTVIAGKVKDGTVQLPSHVLTKVEERIQRAVKKSGVVDMDHYATIEGQLEYCDLRELQDTITAKATWNAFAPVFTNKETLLDKFDKFAELRNGIRHSRAVDTITSKEGEAAILWFQKVLKL